MIQESEGLQKRTRQLQIIHHQFRQMYKDTLSLEEFDQIFRSAIDQLFSKNKISLTQYQVECLYDYIKVLAKKHTIAAIHYDSLVKVQNNCIVGLNLLSQDIADPLQNLKNDTIHKILPFGIRQFGFIDLTKNRTSIGQYWYGYQVFSQIPVELKIAAKNIGIQAQIFIKIINFQWISAASTFHKSLKTDPQFRAKYSILMLIFDNLNGLQKMVNKHKYLKRILEERENLEPIDPEKKQFESCRNQLVEVLNLLELISILCHNYDVFENPYTQAALYFLHLGKNSMNSDYSFIMDNEKMPLLLKYCFSIRFHNNIKYRDYKNALHRQSVSTLNPQYIPFIHKEDRIKKIIQNQLETEDTIQRSSLLSMIMITKKIFNFQTGIPVLHDIVQNYFEYVKLTNSDELQIKFSRFYQSLNDFKTPAKQQQIFTMPSVSIGCPSCGSSHIFRQQLKGKEKKLGPKTIAKKDQYLNLNNDSLHLDSIASFRVTFNNCLQCGYKNTACCVCLQPISMYSSTAYFNEIVKKREDSFQQLCEAFQDSYTFCPKCSHGGHYKHLAEWYARNPQSCPVYNCDCRCKFP